MATTLGGFHSPATKLIVRRPFSCRTTSSTRCRPQNLRIRCSAEEVLESTETEEGWSGGSSSVASDSSISTSRGTSSLISSDNVRKALRGVAITNADHYGRLGIARGISYAEVTVAYTRKCEELMSKELDEEKTERQMLLLKESHDILSSEEERRLYDWSLSRSENPDRYLWPFEVDITQTPTQPPPPQEPEDVGPTRLVGWFFLTWLILSFALSVTLNR